MSRTVLARSVSALNAANSAMQDLLDIGGVPDNSPLSVRVNAALEELYEAVHDIKDTAKNRKRLSHRGPLVYPLRGKDMRLWRLSNGRKASVLLEGRQAARLASASKVLANPSLSYYRPMTASQYLKLLETAVITDAPKQVEASNGGYRPCRVVL